jgi:hypothetical protein
LISRTVAEANTHANYVNLARTWVEPGFGSTGATPPILKIYGYNGKNLNGRQVVLRSYTWNYPDDVDYIWESTEAMPIIGILTLEFDEVYSAEQITAGAWKITAGEKTSKGLASAVTKNLPTAAAKVQAAADAAASTATDAVNAAKANVAAAATGVTSVAGSALTTASSALTSVTSVTKNSVLGNVLGSLTQNAGSMLLNSTKVSTLLSHCPSVVKNVFMSGANAIVTGAANTVKSSLATSTAKTTDGFSRNTVATPANIVGNDS